VIHEWKIVAGLTAFDETTGRIALILSEQPRTRSASFTTYYAIHEDGSMTVVFSHLIGHL
jgi:hypothetical protein